MMTPFLSVAEGGDQENTTSLSPATAVNPTGEPDGTERDSVLKTLQSFYKLVLLANRKIMVHTYYTK